MEEVYVALGSNLGDPKAQIQRAFFHLQQLPHTQLQQVSSLYKTPAWGITEQPDFINAVAKLTTSLSPETLLQELLNIEQRHERVRRLKWGPRTLDCDLLLYGQQVLQSAHLTLPHPGIYERAFVLVPLAEIAPTLVFPAGKEIHFYLSQCDSAMIRKVEI